ncbi:hypothetical protein ACROYT_G015204 [Oculina patagonica]
MDSDSDSSIADADVVNKDSPRTSPRRLSNSCWLKFQVEDEEEAMRIALQKSVSDQKIKMKSLQQASANKQKSENTNKKMATDINIVFCFMEANGMENKRIESLPVSKVDRLLSKFFKNVHRKNEFGDSNPVPLQRTVWWFLSLGF